MYGVVTTKGVVVTNYYLKRGCLVSVIIGLVGSKPKFARSPTKMT